MLFLTLSDAAGAGVRVFSAASLADAAEQVRQVYAAAGDGFGAATTVGVVLPQFTATVTPGSPPTLQMDADAQTQATIRQQARQALANNAAYLGLASPTTAQAVAQVSALTRQVDALIRLAVGDFTGTSLMS